MAGRIRARHLLPYLLVLAIGIGIVWVLQRLLSQAAASDEPRQRTQAAHLALERLLNEHSRTLSVLNALPAFFSSSRQVSPAEFRHFLDAIGASDRAVRWVGFARSGVGPPTLYPPDTAPSVWPSYTRAASTTWRRHDGVHLRRVTDETGDTFILAAQIDYAAIRERALSATAFLGMSITVEHLPDQGRPARDFLIVTRHAGQAMGQVGTDRWRVTASGAPRTPLLAWSRLLLWLAGAGLISLVEVILYTQRRAKARLRASVQAATHELANRNLLLHGLTTAINRPAPGPELGQAICQLLITYLPVADAEVWLTVDHRLVLVAYTTDRAELPDVELVEAWLGQRQVVGRHHGYPMQGHSHLLGMLQATPSRPFGPADAAMVTFVARQTALALESTRLSQAVDHSLHLRDRILRSMSEALAVIGTDDSIVYLNPAGERLLNLTEGIGQPVTTLPLSPHPLIADNGDQSEGTTWLLSRSRRIPLRYKCSSLPDGGTILTLRDVSAEESVTAQKAEFINLASHELRTPLTIIRSHLQALEMADRLGLSEERQQTMREQIIVQVDRLTKLVHDILDASRLATATGPIHLQEIDPHLMLRSTKGHLASKAARKQQTILIQVADPPARPKADPGLLSAVLDNLLDNAINYSPPGRPIILRAEATADKRVALSVQDQGIGITPADLEAVFQPFQRLQTPLFFQVRGTGLGLYLAREWVQDMGGELTVTSTPGHGSTFRVVLPAA